MKLELKHIPQIAYGLEIQILNSKCDYVGIERAKIKGHYYINDVLYLKYEGGSAGKSQNECKPILRPLSDLTKEIEFNGEKFIPSERILKELLISDGLFNIDDHVVSVQFPMGRSNLLIAIGSEVVPECTLGVYENLIKYHFDVFGLIEKGLAVSIHDIE